MKISEKGLALKQSEGCKLNAYQDSVGVWTIGYGHTKDVRPGDSITQGLAEQLLSDELAVFELTVSTAIKYPVTQNQFDAMVSLVFSIGGRAFAQSSLVKKFNAGDITGAAEEFSLWRYAGGRVV